MGNAHTFTHLRMLVSHLIPESDPGRYQALCGAKWHGLTLSTKRSEVTCPLCKDKLKDIERAVTDTLDKITETMEKGII